MEGLKRNLTLKLNHYLETFPVVLIIGARQTGKTTLARQIRPDWKYFDLERGDDFDFITRHFQLFFREYPSAVIIDEAQESPQLFRELRGVVDAQRKLKNRYILTGSSSPRLIKEASDSLAGRIGIVELGTMKVNELEAKSLPAFYKIFGESLSLKSVEYLKGIKSSRANYLDYFFLGTYPEPLIDHRDNIKKIQTWYENYKQTYIERDLRKLFPKLDTVRYRRFLAMLSRLSGTVINKAQIGGSIDVSEVTIRDYLDIADGTFVWRNIPSYLKGKTKNVIKMPRGIFRDSGLAHYLSGIYSKDQLYKSPQVGQSFEAFVTEELIKGLDATDLPSWEYSYYRTKSGSEVDLILEGSFGTLPIEIKFGTSTRIEQLHSLQKFIRDNKLPFGLVINNSTETRLLADQILQVPLNLI